MRFRFLTGRSVFVLVACVRLLPTPALAATSSSGAITAFTAKQSSPVPGETILFEVGITSSDGTSWDPATVSTAISLVTTGGTVLQTSAAVPALATVTATLTTPVFVPLTIATRISGTYAAVATVTHLGNVVSMSAPIPIVIGALRAQIPSKTTKKKPLSFTVGTNATLSDPSAQSLSVQGNGKFADGRSFSEKATISSVNGGSQPNVSFQTATTILRGGIFAPSFDNLVLSGVTGTGFSIRRQLVGASSIQFEMLSSGHATPNPFNLDGLSIGQPIGAGTLSFTAGIARVQGPVDPSLTSFLESGNLFGLDYVHPANDAGFSYELRYGYINYVDGVSDRRRTDHAYEFLSGFNLAKAAWTLDLNHTGPFYPVISAPSLTADRQDYLLTGTRVFGPLSLKVRLEGTQNGLDGTPSTQEANVWSEGVNLGYTLHNNDAIEVDASNAINHVYSDTSVESLTQNLALSYTGKRGVTSFEGDFSTATDQDNAGNTTHTITDALSLGRAVAAGLSLTTRYALTDILANAATATTISQQGSVKLTYAYRAYAFSLGFNRSSALPFTGLTLPASLGLNAGLAFKPKNAPLTVSGSLTQNHGFHPGSVARLNLSRKY
jgi:hypothetical protein